MAAIKFLVFLGLVGIALCESAGQADREKKEVASAFGTFGTAYNDHHGALPSASYRGATGYHGGLADISGHPAAAGSPFQPYGHSPYAASGAYNPYKIGSAPGFRNQGFGNLPYGQSGYPYGSQFGAYPYAGAGAGAYPGAEYPTGYSGSFPGAYSAYKNAYPGYKAGAYSATGYAGYPGYTGYSGYPGYTGYQGYQGYSGFANSAFAPVVTKA